jgi:large subunit ribosomal protein L19
MNNNIVNEVTARQIRHDIPEFSSGDTIRVSVRIIENKKERVQVYEGVVIQRRGHGVSSTFTVRKISSGIGVERTFPLNSPAIAKIELVKAGKVRRARIHYMRNLSGKAARIKETDQQLEQAAKTEKAIVEEKKEKD